MTKARIIRFLEIAAIAIVAFAIVFALGGCKKSADSSETPPGALTAKSALPLAMSEISSGAPDAKLLLVQSRDIMTATSTPVWQFLIGSPKNNTIYAVTVESGEATSQLYGTADLPKEEWDAVPGVDEWKIDSDEAHKKALEVLKDGDAKTPYLMGFVTYVPKANADTNVRAGWWNISFDPKKITKATTNTVEVNYNSGEAVVAK